MAAMVVVLPVVVVVMVTKMVAMVLVLPVAKEEGTPVVRPDGRRWVWSALPVFPRHCLPLNLALLLLLLLLMFCPSFMVALKSLMSL